MSSVRSLTCALLLLALCASAARIQKSAEVGSDIATQAAVGSDIATQAAVGSDIATISEVGSDIATQAAAVEPSSKDDDENDIDSEIAKLDAPDYDNWSANVNNNTKLGLIDHANTQQFELEEEIRSPQPKKYKAYWTMHSTQRQVMTVTNHFFTMHSTQTAEFNDVHGANLGSYVISNPHVINRRSSWRVASSADKSKVLYTIQKRLYDGNCKVDVGVFWWSCKPVIKIYVGHKDDKSSLIYYGVGDRDDDTTYALREPDFKFYRTQGTYQKNKKENWVARIERDSKSSNGEDRYQVKVKPGEDAALLLVATTCLDSILGHYLPPVAGDYDDSEYAAKVLRNEQYLTE